MISAVDSERPAAFHTQSADEVLAAFDTGPRLGLSSDEAAARRERYGRNELVAEEVVPAWRKLLAQFQNALVILLLAAALVSAGLWLVERRSALPYEAIAILAIVLLNAVMGYVQQARAEQAVAALRRMSTANANVLRDGARQSVVATDLVPGDVLLIEEGDIVAADARLFECTSLQMAEAMLTGESLPVAKDIAAIAGEAALGDRRNMVFSGTAASYGHGKAVVTATGTQTELGRIAGLLKETSEEITPLQRELDRVGRFLGAGVVAIAVAMVATILLVEGARDIQGVFDVLILGVALAVAGVPEGLPAVVTAVLSLGVQRLARRNAIVRHLAAVETLGSADVIASDKTGTLTKNEMTVRRIVTASGSMDVAGTGYVPKGEIRRNAGGAIDGELQIELVRALTAADRANNAIVNESGARWTVQGDPTEGALIVAARKAGLEAGALDRRFPRIAEIPFSSERKLMTTVHEDAERTQRFLVFTKGAADVLLARCSHEMVGEQVRYLTAERRTAIARSNEELASSALRTLGVASRSLSSAGTARDSFDEGLEQNLVFLGLIGMIDPPREEAKEAVARAQGAGIRPIMITGDHPATADAIASELRIGSGGRAVTGAEIEAMSDEGLYWTVQTKSVYARVEPKHKLRIVKALQRGGATLAMTGDGVNDAPALKAADIGVAMGITGTDVSKGVADIVLADDNFASIVAAIEEGRAIFSNVRKFLRYLLSSNIGEVMTMFFGVLLADMLGLTGQGPGHLVLPLLATQILWINLVTDGAPALALGVDPVDAGTMHRPPRRRHEGVITRRMWLNIFFVGVVMAAGTLLVLDAALPGGLIEGSGDIRYAQTMAFTTLTMFQLFNVFNARSEDQSAFVGLFSNRWLWGAIGLSLLLHVAVIYVPYLQQAFSTIDLSIGEWMISFSVASSVLWFRELTKLVGSRSREHP